jgi:hypothetical protein
MPDAKGELEIAARISPLCVLVRALLERVLSIDVMDRLFADVVADARSRRVTGGATTTCRVAAWQTKWPPIIDRSAESSRPIHGSHTPT